MSGRLTQRGDNLTISVDLIDVRNKKTLWGEQFERKMSDLLTTNSEIASAITLEAKPTSPTASRSMKTQPESQRQYFDSI